MDPVKILIAFYSRNGSTEALANAIAEGAHAEGAAVVLRRAREIVSRDIMAHAPGWVENADRMNAAYAAPNEADAEARTPSSSAPRPASATFRPS